MGDSIVPNYNVSFSLLRDKLATASFPGVGNDPGYQINVSLSEFRGATFTDGTTVPSGSNEISINDFKGKTFGATTSPQFDWHYYAYGSNIGTIYIYWLNKTNNNSLSLLRSITGQLHTGQTQSWNNYEEDLLNYAGQTGRIVIAYKTGNYWRNDIQLDNMYLRETTEVGGTINLDPGYHLGRNNWQRLVGYTSSLSYPSSGTWKSISTGTSTSNIWNYDAGGTPSNSTGGTRDADGSSSGYYLYFEGSSPNYSSSTRYYWIRTVTDYKLSGGGGGMV